MNDSYLILIVNVIQLACFYFYTKPGVPIRGVFFYYTKFKIKKPSRFVVMATPRQYLISIQHFIQHLFAIQCYLLKVVFLKALLYRRFEVAYYSMQPHNGDDGSRTRVQAYRHFNLYVHISTI